MRWSKMFIPTMKEVPNEAEIPSHQLLLRAGLIRRLGAGLYTFLPLAVKALHRVEAIVREEMDAAGAQEVLMPALHPRELWERTGRYDVLREVMFKIKDRQARDLVLGPTHEEVITDLAAREIASYRQLPVNFYQIQTKFRDEIRPRFGLMRAKEFIMKDAYSFDADAAGADTSYQAMYRAYVNIFKRCGLQTSIVEADTGAMGGSMSHEFMVVTEAGEDGIVDCDSCSYAANLEQAESRVEYSTRPQGADAACEVVDTPGMKTVEEVAGFLGVPTSRLIKTLIYLVGDEPIAVLVPGDREVNEIKLAKACGGAEVALADPATIERVTGAPVGFAGPVGLSIRILADERLRGAADAISGANEADRHRLHVDLDRDAKVSSFADLTLARNGDGCPRCQGALHAKRGVEVGHVFKLGTKYSEKLGAQFLDADGQQRPAIMGCYGIGVSRTLQAVIEQCHDKDGIVWPISVAPFPVEILPISVKHEETMRLAEALSADLESRGIAVLLDDRDERPGFKFKDADLLGMPIRVGIGERSLAKGVVELRTRADGVTTEIPVAEALEAILSKVQELRRSVEV